MYSAQIDQLQGVKGVDDAFQALALFKQAIATGQRRRLWRWIRGCTSSLRARGAISQHGMGNLGRQTVAIDAIVGSEGRTGDFDSGFAPLNQRTRDRWISVATARQRGSALPPVLLVRTDEGYYVRDGHHRISVARALGEEFVEAEVVG